MGYMNTSLVIQLCLTLCGPLDYSLPGSSCPWDFPGKNTGVGCHFLSPGDLSNLCLLCFLHCRWILYLLNHQGSPSILIHLSTILQPKGNELLIQATTRMNLRNILHKRSQLQKTVHCMIPFI